MFNWIDYLSLAKSLITIPVDPKLEEACYRTSASRAYYAAFHLAKERAEKDGYPPNNTGDDHKQVQVFFTDYKPIDRKRRKISLELNRLLDIRRKADYRVEIKSTPEYFAKGAIDLAESIIYNLLSLN